MTTPLTLDWLDALLILRRVVDSHDVRWMASDRVELEWNITSSHRVVEIYKQKQAPFKIQVKVRYSIETLPKIERIEVLTYAAACVWWMEHYPGDPSRELPREAFQNLCFKAGCYFTNTPDIRERWRLLDFYRPASELPNSCFETRPICRLCTQPVATGSSAILRQHAPEAGKTAFTVEWDENVPADFVVQCPDLHEECARYIHRVMVPARQLQIDTEKRQTTAEVDK